MKKHLNTQYEYVDTKTEKVLKMSLHEILKSSEKKGSIGLKKASNPIEDLKVSFLDICGVNGLSAQFNVAQRESSYLINSANAMNDTYKEHAELMSTASANVNKLELLIL